MYRPYMKIDLPLDDGTVQTTFYYKQDGEDNYLYRFENYQFMDSETLQEADAFTIMRAVFLAGTREDKGARLYVRDGSDWKLLVVPMPVVINSDKLEPLLSIGAEAEKGEEPPTLDISRLETARTGRSLKENPVSEWVDVESSLIAQAKYEPTSQRLYIKLKNGLAYRYDGVTRYTFNMFLNANSQGQYFNRFIKGKYSSQKIEGADEIAQLG